MDINLLHLRTIKETELTWNELDSNFTLLNEDINNKISYDNIKTINGSSILGSGNITIDKTSIGLSNVDNTSDIMKPVSMATEIALSAKMDIDIFEPRIITLETELSNVYTQIEIDTKFTNLVGLAPTTLDTLQELAVAVENNETELGTFLSAIDSKQTTLLSGTNIKTINGSSILGSGNITIDKTSIGLSNVDNTSDIMKPVSTATQTALDSKQDTLVSGTNIKTINGTSILGTGDIVIQASTNNYEIVQTLPTPSLSWLKKEIYVIDLATEYVCVADTLTPTDIDCFWLQR